MKAAQYLKTTGAVAALVTIMIAGITSSPRVQAGDDRDWNNNDQASLIRRGFEIAPVPLNLEGKEPDLVGLGSYLVNAVSDCNSCHTAGQPPNFDYANGNNPYFGQKKKVDPTTYMGGGQDFGQAIPGAGGPDIISRNLTPDKTGLPEGGHTLEQFMIIMRTGKDFDHLHPTCSATESGANCIPPPVDGSLLQVMPWPTFQNMTDHDLRAIYEYLSAIPCYEGPADPANPLHNDCK
jgi:hypothetical protein